MKLITVIYYILDLLIAGIIYLCLYLFWRHQDRRIRCMRTVLYLSMILVIFFTLSPVTMYVFGGLSGTSHKINLIPFIDWYYHYGHYQAETAGNIVLFLPFGYAFAQNTRCTLKQTVLAGMLFSICVECIQPFLTASRICDVSDMITNTFGTFLGACLFLCFHRKKG